MRAIIAKLAEKNINGTQLLAPEMDWGSIGLETEADAIKKKLQNWTAVRPHNVLDNLKLQCPAPSKTKLVLTRDKICELWKDKVISKYWNLTKIPFNVVNGKVDFHFLDKPFFDDPIINALQKDVRPNESKLVTVLGASGIGKTGMYTFLHCLSNSNY